MNSRLKPLAALLPALFATNVATAADQSQELANIIISAARIATPDVAATYASEVHSRADIENSGAQTLYDYLANHTSVAVMPSYGNRFTPKIDMRGYGIGDGYQNIVVSVDGQRLNNIDMNPQMIGGIALSDIERIEITKGSGSVIYGDGATAGTIQIYTKAHQGVGIQAYAGSQHSFGSTITAGAHNEFFSISGSYDRSTTDGASKADVTGRKASSDSEIARLSLSGKLGEALTVKLDGYNANLETRYPGALTQSQFNSDPSQNAGHTYSYQELKSNYVRGSLDYQLTEQLKLSASHGQEDKQSAFVGWISNYDHTTDEIVATYESNRMALTGGYQQFDATRFTSSDQTTKKNSAWFANGQLFIDALTLSAGLRQEKVAYAYNPTAGTSLKQDNDLWGWDIGANYRINNQLSAFANLNHAFQAPDIDRFFNFGTFNQFIAPAKVNTLNLGINHVTAANRLKATLFHAKLDNEIYYYSTGSWLTSYNTNIDKSHKYGVELQDTWKATDTLSLSAKYAYTRAIIDREQDGGGAYNGKELPGVSKHTVNLAATYRFGERSTINLNQAWRSSAWAAEDFDNNNAQKQRAYASTDVAYRYRYQQFDFFASIENLFARKNGIWIKDDAIYPVNFSRAWRIGVQAHF